MLKVQRGDDSVRRDVLAPIYLTVGNRRIPLDVLLFIVGLVFIFFNQQIAQYLPQVSSTNAVTLGEILLFGGAVLFVFGRIELK